MGEKTQGNQAVPEEHLRIEDNLRAEATDAIKQARQAKSAEADVLVQLAKERVMAASRRVDEEQQKLDLCQAALNAAQMDLAAFTQRQRDARALLKEPVTLWSDRAMKKAAGTPSPASETRRRGPSANGGEVVAASRPMQ